MVIEFVSFTSGSGNPNTVVARPSGIQNGDVMLALQVTSGSSTGIEPTGWSSIGATFPINSSNNNRGILHYKVVNDTGSEPSSYTFTRTPSGISYVLIAVYRGVDTSEIFDTPHTYYQDDTGTPLSLPSITTVTNGAMFLVVDAVLSVSNTVTPEVTGMTIDALYLNRARAFLSEIRPVAGPTGSRILTRSSTVYAGGILTALRPASGDPPGPTAKPWTEAFVVE